MRQGGTRLRELSGRYLAAIGALIAVAALQILAPAVLARVGYLIFDSYQRAAPRPYQDTPVRVVSIDEESIRRHGQWPWPRTEVARLIAALTDGGAAAIALDVVLSEPDRTSPGRLAATLDPGRTDPGLLTSLRALPDNDAVLAKTMSEAPIVSGFFLTHDPLLQSATAKAGVAVLGAPPQGAVPAYQNAVLPLANLEQAATGLGFLSLDPDEDGVVRQVPLLAEQHGRVLPSLVLETLRVAQGAGAIAVKSGGKGSGITAVKTGAIQIPTDAAGKLWLHYTATASERVMPAWKVLAAAVDPPTLAQMVSGRIVVVGAGAVGLRDLVTTPLGRRALGSEVHAQALEQVILQKFLLRPDWAPGLELALTIALGLLALLLVPRLGAVRGAVLALGLAFGSATASWIAFRNAGYLLDPTSPLIAVLTIYSIQAITGFTLEERRRRAIHRAFDHFLSPELVKRMAADPAALGLGGEERTMAVMFCDIRDFSLLAERLSPQETTRFLGAFMTPMCEVLLAHRATIDKFMGDGILAFWNAPLDDPDQHEHAARAALAMTRRLAELNRDMPNRADHVWPGEVRIGIGLNSGTCCVGNLGSAQRLSYSLIGDAVNLAARLEGLTKVLGVPIVLGSDFVHEIPQFAVLSVDRMPISGRAGPEEVSILLGDETLAADGRFAAFGAAYEEMQQHYCIGDLAEAQEALDRCALTAEALGLGGVLAHYRERIARAETA